MTAVQTLAKTQSGKKLEGKVAIVTGGARGIGAGIAKRLADDGATVVVNYVNGKDAAEKVVAQLTGEGARALALQADVSKEDDVKRLVAETVKAYGKIDILVNNAGVYDSATVEQTTLKHFDKIFDTNVKGVIATTVATLPQLNDGGRIINISSVAADMTVSGFAVYSASKSALNTLTRVWAQDLGARKITVNNVAPGVTESDMMHQALPKEVQSEMASKTALGRIGQPADIADVVAFLASDDARWITGQSIKVDGGLL